MQFQIENLKQEDLKQLPNFDKLEFGRHYSDRMFLMQYTPDKGWHDAKITKFHNFKFSPATMVLHYSQEIFEGLKAYYRNDNKIGLFRPEENFKRLNRSAKRMCMPEINTDFAMEALLKLLELETKWVPLQFGSSLYIRPTIIGADPYIGLKPSESFLFYIILSPVGAYFKTDGLGLKVLVEEKYARAIPGGTGEAKTGGNYAASLAAGLEAQKLGYSQVLWLDGSKRKYIEEMGTNNIFFVYKNSVVTPKLNGSILPGITRKSVIELLKHWKTEIKEEELDIDSIIQDIHKGKITEAFGSGTAVVIAPITTLGYRGTNYNINQGKSGSLTEKIYTKLTDIQYGKTDDIFGWTKIIS